MLITTLTCSKLSRCGPFFYKIDRLDNEIRRGDFLFIFKGYLYPDLDEAVDDLFGFLTLHGVDRDIKRFKGRYCGCLMNKRHQRVIIFNDQLGLYDIFYYYVNRDLIISDKFTEFFTVKNFSRQDLDVVAMAEFLLYTHVLRDRTFLKDVKLLPLASMRMFDLGISKTNSLQYWQYRFNTQKHFNKGLALEKVDDLLKQSMQRIKALNHGSSFAIGLSGGYDSRLAARYALDADINLSAFVSSHGNSDAYHISRQLAQKITLPLKRVNIQTDYMRLKGTHMQYDPMHSIMYASYCTVMDELPEAEALLTGFLGGELFGNHIRPWDNNPEMGVIEKLEKRLTLYYETPLISERIRQDIVNDLANYENVSTEDWHCCEIFEYENRQRRFIKSSPGLNFYGRYDQHYSIFADIDLVEYVQTFPLEQLMNKKFYFEFYRRFLPDLATIRAERQAFTPYDKPALRNLKTYALNLKLRVLYRFGIALPIFRTIGYGGHLDWNKLFPYCHFDQAFKDIKLEDIFAYRIKQLPDRYLQIKYHYLTLQYFIETFLDRS